MTSQSGIDTVAGGAASTIASGRPLAAGDSRPHDADSDIDDSFLVGVAAAPPVDPDQQTVLMPGAHVVGKYRIEARIGQGGMGTVYRATDTRLQRAVAIKIHHALGTRVERLRREARMLARLSHPNVVTVLEVGTHEGMLFVAMEYVDGGNARGWLRAQPRSWREIVELYRLAGRGLAAAHALGIVHRDFKPDNVLVGGDGRPRVADFGLAGTASDSAVVAEQTLEAMLRSLAQTTTDATQPFATEAGVMVGTPAYVAPEQIGSSRVDARADQFGFCAALFEAIYARLPFPGDSVQQIVARIATGELVLPPDRTRAPPWVLTVLERGMAHDPGDRFADMDALLAALAGPRRRRRWVPVLALAGVVALLGAAFTRTTSMPSACLSEPASTGWPARRAEIAASVEALADRAATGAWGHLEGRLVPFERAWSSVRDVVCAAASGDLSEADTRRRARELECLADGANAIDALFTEISAPTLISLTRGAEVAQHLQNPERCIGAVATEALRPPAAIAGEVDALAGELAKANTRMQLGQVYDASALAEVVVASAQQLGWPPLIADALHARARGRTSTGRRGEAIDDARASYEEARRVGYDRGMARAADLLAALTLDAGDLNASMAWNSEARAHLTRGAQDRRLLVILVSREAEIRAQRDEPDAARSLIDDAGRLVEDAQLGDDALAIVESTRASLALGSGDFGEAIRHYELARDAYGRAFGEMNHEVARAWHEIAVVYVDAGNYVEARNAYDHALEIYDRIGDVPVFQFVGIKLGVASCADMLGDGKDALRRVEQAEELYRSAGLDDHRLAEAIGEARGVILLGLGRGDDALAALQGALVHSEQIYGEAHVELRPLLANLALAAREAGDSALAEVYLQRALMIESTLARDDVEGAVLYHSYGFLLLERGQLDAAAAQFERAGNILEELVGIDSPDMGWVELGRGRIALSRGNFELARLSLERGDALWSDDSIPPEDRADLQRDLAVALWETGDRARALAVARGAAEMRPDDEQLRAWLAAHTK